MRKGFTLIELIIVVIVVGILATIAIPQYLRATERAKGAKARSALALIASAEKQCRAETDTYTNSFVTLATYVEMDQITNDADWTYTIPTANATDFDIQASRRAGARAGQVLRLQEDGGTVGSTFVP